MCQVVFVAPLDKNCLVGPYKILLSMYLMAQAKNELSY